VTVDGVVLGAPIKVNLKSLVWFQPNVFAANGYEIPETFAELVALSDEMVADGEFPWCNYIEPGFATGWVGTDWIVDLVLRADGPAVYDDWVDHTVLFRSGLRRRSGGRRCLHRGRERQQ
jgi:alpha-glucoside transport system substrate-binding protein